MTSTTSTTAFVLDAQGHPAVLPAALRHDSTSITLQITYSEETITEMSPTDALPGGAIADLEQTELANGEPMWVASLSRQAPAGLYVWYWTQHCGDVDLILGLWRPDRAVPALHVRGRNDAGIPVVVSIPLDPDRHAQVKDLISRDPHRLLDEALDW